MEVLRSWSVEVNWSVIGPFVVGIVVAVTAASLANRYAVSRERANYLLDQKKEAYLRMLHAFNDVFDYAVTKGMQAQKFQMKSELDKAMLDVKFFGTKEINRYRQMV